MEKNINYYMKLPYNRIIQEINDESGHYFYGRIMELEGCQSTQMAAENPAVRGRQFPEPEAEQSAVYYGNRKPLRMTESNLSAGGRTL